MEQLYVQLYTPYQGRHMGFKLVAKNPRSGFDAMQTVIPAGDHDKASQVRPE
jgi:hypothetical protein